jgi:hypothetical protein
MSHCARRTLGCSHFGYVFQKWIYVGQWEFRWFNPIVGLGMEFENGLSQRKKTTIQQKQIRRLHDPSTSELFEIQVRMTKGRKHHASGRQ